MESELKDLNPNSNSNQQQSLDPIDEASSKDDRPLLKPDDSAPLSPPPISAANIEELEKKFTAFVRNDVYGTMGRGELPDREGSARNRIPYSRPDPSRPRDDDTGFLLLDLPNLYVVLVAESGGGTGGLRALGRVEEGYIDGKLNTETDVKDQSEEPERPGAIISNHISHLDILYHMSSFFPSFVAKRSVAKLPLVGLISKCLGCIYVQRESKSSDFKGVSGVVNERVQEAYRNKFAPMMMLFPEGTTTNGDFLLPFKTGAFLSKAPVRPVILRYPYQRFSPAWDSISGVRHVIFLFCQFVNYLEVTRLPVYYPSQQEKDDPKLYANNVRRLMAREGNLILSDIGLAEKRIYHAALNG
ncbi:Lysophospholipid acyltransferase LPEAT1 [Camellia lanceoleosa]|uniref:Lysophospholipid acyltransferase LPEAT1 n=1 Tax=Camellia lanceoleosa TaxID=1840588 RepID=A0ACC0HWY7_9ERIC|nr:Lysophospholipid acyltransferase LPEAT1 [Camellia lanceoleosa]